MAECILLKGGGSGLDPDELTATPDKVLSGYTAGVKGSDEPADGTMPNRGTGGHAVESGVNTSGLWFKIPYGYYDEPGQDYPWVYRTQAEVAATAGLTAAKLMKNQSVLGISGTATSDANATAAYIYNGKTAYVNGVKITGGMTVGSVVNFSVAAYSATQFTCTWQWPSHGPYSGVIIRGKLGGYPTNAWDGQLVYQGTGNNAGLGGWSSTVISGAQQGDSGTTYYFRCWVYCTCSAGDMYSGYKETTATTKAKGLKTFTSSGTFTVPAGVTSIDVCCVGGGASGLPSNSFSTRSGGGAGGGGGRVATKKGISVSPGQKYSYTVGAGGATRIYPNNRSFNAGSASSFGTLLSADGGYSDSTTYSTAKWGCSYYGGSGGSAGGVGGGSGGISNGASNGGSTTTKVNTSLPLGGYGTGQGTTTRAFGESSGTLYAGGGGGGGYYYDGSTRGDQGNGGAGGGGNGGDPYNGGTYYPGKPGTYGTGGGGGGGADYSYAQGNASGGAGGSGIVLVRWGY